MEIELLEDKSYVESWTLYAEASSYTFWKMRAITSQVPVPCQNNRTKCSVKAKIVSNPAWFYSQAPTS